MRSKHAILLINHGLAQYSNAKAAGAGNTRGPLIIASERRRFR